MSTAQRRTLGGHLYQLKFDDAQAIVDELAGRMVREKVFNPIRYCVAMIEKLKRGDFVPELGIPIAERRGRKVARRGPASSVEEDGLDGGYAKAGYTDERSRGL